MGKNERLLVSSRKSAEVRGTLGVGILRRRGGLGVVWLRWLECRRVLDGELGESKRSKILMRLRLKVIQSIVVGLANLGSCCVRLLLSLTELVVNSRLGWPP